jgi:hypothetical protein
VFNGWSLFRLLQLEIKKNGGVLLTPLQYGKNEGKTVFAQFTKVRSIRYGFTSE